jgi:hypothetical protein
MLRVPVPRRCALKRMAAILLLLAASPPLAHAAGPILIVRHTDGIGVAHSVGSIQKIVPTGSSLSVVTASGTEAHGLSEIRKIEFVWDPEAAGVEDPNVAAGIMRIAHLFQNRPNPFAPETQIAFDLPKAGQVGLAIYGADGRLVRQLLSEQRGVGRHTVSWDGRDDAGKKVASGTYFYQLRASGVEETRRMILLP